MRSRDLIDGFDYNEHMQRQMFCFGSSDDTGSSGPDRSNPNEMRAREQNFVDTRYGGDSDSFMKDVADRNLVTVSAASEQAAAEAQARAGLGNIGSDRGVDAAAVNAALNNIAAAVTQAPKSTGGITAEQVAAMNAAQRAMEFTPYSNTINDPVYSGQTSAAIGLEGQDRRLGGLTRAQYGAMPSYMQNIYDKTGAYNFEFGPKGRVTGFYGPPGGAPFPGLNMLGKGIVGLTDMLLGPPMTEEDLALRSFYTGFGEGSQPDGGRDEDPRPPVKPVDPATGQCDEGYMFDEDMQACRLDTRSSMGGQPSLPQVPFRPGGYARMGLLDEAPTNLPQFQQRYGAGFGSPSDFAAANTAFRQQSAYRPEYFKRPYPTDGYNPLLS